MSYFKVAMFILRRKPLVFLFTLLVMVLLGYLAILVTGYIRGLYYVNNQVIGSSDGIVVSSYALSPLTSIIDSNRLDKIVGNISGIKVEYHMITISYIYDTPVLIRGVNSIDTSCIYLSNELVNKFKLSAGDIVPLYSPFTNKIMFLKLCGFSEGAFSAINYNVSTIIRGVKPGYYSIAVIRSSNKSALEEVARVLGISDIDQRSLTRALLLLTQVGDRVTIKLYEDIAEGYLTRLGLYRDIVLYAGYFISLVVLVGSLVLGVGLVVIIKRELKVFDIIGLPRLYTLAGLAITTTLELFISITLIALLIYIKVSFEVKFFTLRLPPVIELEDYVFVFLTMMTLSLIGITLGFRRAET
ncbi:MAG: hypothetical protein QXE81_03215 [Desulfurococcaceae archaeon]